MVVNRLIALPRWTKRTLVILLDFILLLQAAWISYSLRIGVFTYWNEPIAKIVLVTVPSALILFAIVGVYKTIFRFADLGVMRVLTRAFFIYGFLMIIVLTIGSLEGVPRTLGILQPLILFLMMIGSRIAVRFVLIDLIGRRAHDGAVRNVLIYGAGQAGRQIASSLRAEPTMNLVGFVDDDRPMVGQKLEGKPIFSRDTLGQTISERGVTDILLALPSASRRQRQSIVDSLQQFKIAVQTLPQLSELAQGHISVNDIRPLEIEDLLGRAPVAPNEGLLTRTIVGKSILVTGAGGSIGSELCRQIAKLDATTLVLYELNEFSLYKIEAELTALLATKDAKTPEIVPVLGSVCDAHKIAEVFTQYKIQTVYHAAAYKHVPLVEANPVEAIRNNVLGTYQIVTEAQKAGANDVILISTDKAVRPTNVMGATKRAAEQLLQCIASDEHDTRFSMVRFGNVLGSSGSVVPLFRQQIEAGGPITLTHKEITRYFMTIPEAAGLVLQAAGMAVGGEVFVLDMGRPVKIGELAKTMVQLSGLTLRDESNPDGDIAIEEVGLRPGEKLYEELLIGNSPQETAHPRIMMAQEAYANWSFIKPRLEELKTCRDSQRAIEILSELVPEFDHQPLGDIPNRANAEKESSE